MRFPEFTGEWKKSTIGSLSTKVGSGVTPRGGETVYKSEGHSFVRSQNVGWGHLQLDDIAFIDKETHLRQKNTELQLDDVLLNITGASIGRSALVNKQIAGGNVNQHVCIIRTKDNLVPAFLCNFLLSNHGQKQIDSFQAGGNRQGLNFEQIRSIKITIPSTKEQTKIATLLHLIDERIATQNKIIEDLKKLKSAIIERHYNQAEKQTVFIADLGEPFNVGNLSKDDLSETGKPCIIYGELFTTYGETISQVESHTNKKEGMTLSKKGDLLFPTSTTVDAISLIAPSFINIDGVILGGDMFGIHINPNYNAQYLSYYFNHIANRQLAKYAKGSTIIHLHYTDIENAKLLLPSLEEQNRMAKCLVSLDAKINIENIFISLLKSQKIYFLYQMFI
ncbi:restriction endonuclease subunit S [Bacteroides sp. AF32-8BH]|uniref:restriction endonuclease subunit S n=1 Tax=Bacteroides sp. AF32-8BH TaxID=2302925 RepID=UPI001F2D42AE|nr:restriction endonuclease subunit S [Bacteroides sp. AF32-8BH]